MRRPIHSLLIASLLLASTSYAQIFPNLGGQRAGLSALSFLKNEVSPRSLALSGSSVAMPGDGYALFVNPAAAIDQTGLNITTANMMVGAGVHQTFLSGILPHESSAFGLSVNALNSGSMEVRTEFQPEGTGQQFYATNIATGLTYSRTLSDMFSIGITLKYVYEKLAEYTNHTATADLGFRYNTDFKDLRFAVLVQNFGGNSSVSGDFLEVEFNRDPSDINVESFSVPTVFRMGMSMIPYKKEGQALLVNLQVDHPNDNAENLRLGAEYAFHNLFFARAGYKINVEGQTFPSLGAGVRAMLGAHALHIDYAVNPTNHMGIQHAVGLSFTINKVEGNTNE